MTRFLMLSAAAVGMLALTATVDVTPAAAQTSVRVGPGGVVVRDHRPPRWHRPVERCRVITERHRTPSGRVVVRRTRVCR